MQIIKGNSEVDTNALGVSIAQLLKKGDILALVGDLGTGKTTITKAIAKGLGISEDITSPTFNIVKEYLGTSLPLYHFDVYRVHDPEELFNIGIDDYFYGEGVCIIEWANLIEDILPPHTKKIHIEYGASIYDRIYTLNFNL